MKFYYDIEYRNGSRMSGHNCEEVKMNENYLIIKGYDLVLDYEGDYVPDYWSHVDRIEDIKSFKLEVMAEIEEE